MSYLVERSKASARPAWGSAEGGSLRSSAVAAAQPFLTCRRQLSRKRPDMLPKGGREDITK